MAEFIYVVPVMDCPVCKTKISAAVTYVPSLSDTAMPKDYEPSIGEEILNASFSVKPVNVSLKHNCRGEGFRNGG